MDFTIQPEVDKMKEQIDIKSVTSKVKKISNNRIKFILSKWAPCNKICI